MGDRRGTAGDAQLSSGEPPPGDADHLLDQLFVGEAGRARRLGKAGVHGGVGDDAGQWIELEDVRHPEPVYAEIDAAPVAGPEGVIRVERGALDLAVQTLRDPRGALENRE